MKSVSIIGAGRLGGALAIALDQRKYNIKNIFVKNKDVVPAFVQNLNQDQVNLITINETAEIFTDLIFITTQDSEIKNVACEIEGHLRPNTVIYHTSGALSSEILSGLKKNDIQIASFHPLVSISDPIIGASRFRNAYFCLEGDLKAIEIAEKIVEDLQGKSFSIETQYKTLYHASAVTACGHLVALIDVALEMLEKCGLSNETAKLTLLPLIRSTVENLEDQTPTDALTGTFARADFETFQKHSETLKKNVSGEAYEIYNLLGQRSVKLARQQGANPENLQKILEQLLIAKKNFK